MPHYLPEPVQCCLVLDILDRLPQTLYHLASERLDSPNLSFPLITFSV
jgi:hypothetical protein